MHAALRARRALRVRPRRAGPAFSAVGARAPPKVTHRIKRAALWRLALATSVPMVGFGFADNAIMLVAGEAIDNLDVWRRIGWSTMAAAGVGNLFSDAAGVGLGGVIEGIAIRVGIQAPALSMEQSALPAARWARFLGGLAGVTLGCFLGLLPLLFFEHDPEMSLLAHLTDEELELYNTCFRDFTVSPKAFARLLRAARTEEAQPGEVIGPRGETFDAVLMILAGSAEAFEDPEHTEPIYSYTPGFADGSNVIGASRIVDEAVANLTYPNEVRSSAAAPTRYIRWSIDELEAIMDRNPAIKAAILNSLCGDIVTGKRIIEPGGKLLLSGNRRDEIAKRVIKSRVTAKEQSLLKQQVIMNAELLEEVVKLRRETRALQARAGGRWWGGGGAEK